MGRCIYSHDDGAYCDKHDHGAVTVGCCGEDKCRDRKALTNADRIRSMTDEELAEFLCKWDSCQSTEGLGYNTLRVGNSYLCDAPGGGDIRGECQVCALEWLKQEAT